MPLSRSLGLGWIGALGNRFTGEGKAIRVWKEEDNSAGETRKWRNEAGFQWLVASVDGGKEMDASWRDEKHKPIL